MGVTYNYGAGPTYTKIASRTLGSAVASVTFSNLPQNYTDLVIAINGNLSGTGVKIINFNGVSTLYSCTTLIGSGSATSSGRYSDPYLDVSNASSNQFVNITQINNYSNSTTFKTYLSRQGAASTSTEAIVGLWRSTAAITSISISASGGQTYASGSTFTLYGVAAALKPKAIGGTVTFDPATSKWVHTFTSSGIFTPTQGLSVDYLVVAGGGGGGVGGGGAGGLRSTVTATGGGGSLESPLTLAFNTNYTVTVGAGGSGSQNGFNSVFSTITASGGGYAGVTLGPGTNGNAGGSGGGANTSSAGTARTGGAGTANQGFAGGNSAATSGEFGGGGGGAGAVGANGTLAAGGNGGAGVASSISGSSVTYAGGGGGTSTGGTDGTGGTGGGGNAETGATGGQNGTVNSGGGGGGGYGITIGNGGSGIVIVRYSA